MRKKRDPTKSKKKIVKQTIASDMAHYGIKLTPNGIPAPTTIRGAGSFARDAARELGYQFGILKGGTRPAHAAKSRYQRQGIIPFDGRPSVSSPGGAAVKAQKSIDNRNDRPNRKRPNSR